jgi:hypothetical protein
VFFGIERGEMITKKEALDVALEYLKEYDSSSKYDKKSPFIYEVEDESEDEIYVEFQDKDLDAEPGVCILAINVHDGTVRVEPAE